MNQVQTQQKGVKTYLTETGIELKLSVDIIRRQLVSGAGNITDQEANFFMALCSSQGLNPFIKEAYIIKYGDKSPATMIVGKDVIFRRGTNHPDFDGLESGVIVIHKETGELEYKRGAFYNKKTEELVGAWATVHRKSWKYPIGAEVNFDEYAQRKNDGSLNNMWSTKPATMITKVAKVHALREAFTESLQGMYDADEMGVDTSKLEQPGQAAIQQSQQEIIDIDPDDMPFDHKQAPKKNDGRKFL